MTQATIRKWASRGKITRYGTAGRALYDLCELFEITTESTDRSCSGLCPKSVFDTPSTSPTEARHASSAR
jgi:hypothetical protein